MYNGKIPFDGTTGDLLHFATDPVRYPTLRALNTVWRENFDFPGTIRFIDMNRGRSGVHFIVEIVSVGRSDAKELEGKKATMFLSKALELLKSTSLTMSNGEVSGTWCFYKQGCNYSIGLV